MEKIECKACSAIVDKSIEFCSSCGEWLGLKLDEVVEEPSRISKRIMNTRKTTFVSRLILHLLF